MTQAQILARRAREVLLDGRWIANTNYKDQLDRITWRDAVQKIGELNTIAALVFHVNYYLVGLNLVFNGGPLEIRDEFSFDLPPITSASDWKKLVDELIQNSKLFVENVEHMDDAKLDEPFVNEKYGRYRRNIEAVIEHGYYHLGQISLIRKMIQSDKP